MRERDGQAVLIVGAGPTGLVLGIELARRGVPFHLIDRLKEPLGWDRATVVKCRTLEIFAGLGLADTFLGRGQVVRGIDVYSDARKVAGYRFGHLDTPYPCLLSIPEDETEQILNGKLEKLGGRVERGVEFLGLEQSEAGVRARLRSEDAGERVIEASWVVGTDGLRSPVRAAMDDSFDGQDYPLLWGVVDSHLSGWRHPRAITCAQLRPPVVIPFALGQDRWRIYFRPASTGADVLTDIANRLAVVSPGVELRDPDEPKFFHAHSRVARRYRNGRVLIAGDAAHASNPIEGHGMNAGIQDAYNLGWKLALAVAGRATDALMDSYEAERRPVAQAIVRSGDEAEVATSESGSDAREAMFEFLSTVEGRDFAALAESELDFGYADSPIVAENGTAAPLQDRETRIGFRVGEADGLIGRNGSVRLRDLIAGPDHTVFLMLADAGRLPDTEALAFARAAKERFSGLARAYAVTRVGSASEPLADDVLWDRGGNLHDRLASRGPALCIIRPDGHLGFRSHPPSLDALDVYLRRLFT
jgi:2-polyprenyl-6-methoxyphenol hydroxylase-like FAD-dependent oxidoreductase